jgi:hypothetical protein
MYVYKKWYIEKCFLDILNELGYPPIRLLSRKEFIKIAGLAKKHSFGMSCIWANAIWINRNHPSDSELKDTIYHEILHCLFPKLPEWWIELSAKKLSYNKNLEHQANAIKLGKTTKDIPTRSQLLQMIKGTSDHINGKVK